MRLIDVAIKDIRARLNVLRPSVKRSIRFQKMMTKNNLDAFESMYDSAEFVEEYMLGGRGDFFRLVAAKVAQLHDIKSYPQRYMDMGCGTGHLMMELVKLGLSGEIIGCDYAFTSQKVVEKVCPEATFQTADIYELQNGLFDFITCTEVLEHLSYPEKAVNSMLSSLKPGGKLFITVPDGRKDTWEGHIHFWSPQSFELFLEKFGSYKVEFLEEATNFGIIFKQ